MHFGEIKCQKFGDKMKTGALSSFLFMSLYCKAVFTGSKWQTVNNCFFLSQLVNTFMMCFRKEGYRRLLLLWCENIWLAWLRWYRFEACQIFPWMSSYLLGTWWRKDSGHYWPVWKMWGRTTWASDESENSSGLCFSSHAFKWSVYRKLFLQH